MKFTKEQEIFIIGNFCGGDVAAADVRRNYLLKYEISGRAKYQYLARDFARVLERFKKNGISSSHRLIPSASEAYTTNVSRVREYFSTKKGKSLQNASQELDIPKSSIWKILRKQLRWRPYKIQQVQKVNPANFELRDTFCLWFLSQGRHFHKKVLFGDEKWWVLDAPPNRQNDRVWSPISPQEFEECRYQGKAKAMSWVGILDGAIIGPFWFLDNFGQPVNVNQENYLEMLREKVWPCLEEKNTTRHIWFQQDGAPSHTSNIVMDWLNLKFPGRVISRKSNVPWPPQSPDLNPLDYWLWGYCLSLVRKQNPQTIALMVQSVNDVCSVLEREQILKATGGIYKRMEKCREVGGMQFQHIFS